MILPLRVFGQILGPDDPLRPRELADPFGDGRRGSPRSICVGALGVALERDEGADRLAGLLVGLADHGRLGDGLVGDDRRLDLSGREPVARDVDDVVDPADHPEVAVPVLARRVADEVGLAAEAAEVGLDEALVVLVERAQHRRPRALEHEQALALVDRLALALVDDLGLDPRERRASPSPAWSR